MEADKSCHWYVFDEGQLLLQRNPAGYAIPFFDVAPIPLQHAFPITMPDGTNAMAAFADHIPEENAQFVFVDLRTAFDYLEQTSYEQAGKAYELLYWDKHSRFCPVCGTATEHKESIMKKCPACQYELFPAVSPAVIVLIRKEQEILLVRAHNFRGPFHGLVAGFLETGETLEQCVEREVYEETGLRVKNITYFGNQPWPYPSTLMIGFIADYADGEIRLQETELKSGAFFSKDRLPEIPRKLSLARKMIDWWLAQQE